MLRILAIALVMLGPTYSAFAQLASADHALLETGGPAKPPPPVADSAPISIVTYNIRWRTGAELQRLGEWLKTKHPLVIALQEVDRAKLRTNKTDNARTLAGELGMYYAWAAPPLPQSSQEKEEETGVELLSPYPLSEVTRIVLPHEGPGGRWRVALGATVKIGKTEVRVYSVHAETRIPLDQKVEQFRAVLADLNKFAKSNPAIVMGDFNSWEPATVKKVRELFTAEKFATPFSDDDPTFKRSAVIFDIDLKLDWIWLRNLTAASSGIDRNLTVSDHFPLWAVAGQLPSSKSRQQ